MAILRGQQPARAGRRARPRPVLFLGLVALAAQAAADEPVWAINVGGPAYDSRDGISYAAETAVTGGVVRRVSSVKGSQDAAIYEDLREGDIRVERAIENGVYDVTLHFAEPDEVARGQRLFDTLIEGEIAIDDLDVMLFRDGKIRSALTVTVPGIEVRDGSLSIRFEASSGKPVLAAVVVRRPYRRADDWSLVWSDEFDGDALDTTKWTPNVWPARKVNDEDQAYTARDKNLRVEDGLLVLESHREDYAGARYTSARIHSAGKGDFLYGRFEIRARLPRGMGTWPAIWMLPSDPFRYATSCESGTEWQGNDACDAWPNSGEIDIMEHVGYQMGHVHGTVHNEAYYWVKWEQRKGRVLIPDLATAFHTYSMEWGPERIDVFVDDTLYFSYVNEGEGWRSWPYDQPFHLILNQAVGGQWGRSGGGIDDSMFPQQLHIDYVRAYERVE